MADWNGQSRGTVPGIKVFVFFVKYLGLHAAYALLCLPVPYFVLFSPKTSRNIFTFFRKRMQYSVVKSVGNIFKTYFVFGQTLIDRIAVETNSTQKFSFEFDGIENLQQLFAQQKGGILLTAHVGNFNMSRSFFEQIPEKPTVNMVITDNEHQHIKDYMVSITGKSSLNFIPVEKDKSHIFKISEALAKHEWLVFAADRSGGEGAHLETDFLGKKTRYFQGPFKLAGQRKIPIVFVYIMREPNFHYHLYARTCSAENLTKQRLLEAYTQNLEKIVERYPNQWFNFYDYWYDFKKKP